MSAPALDETKLAAARLWAASRLPYLASALFACTPHPAPGSQTVAVDRAWRIQADPAVVEQFEVADLGRLLIHLVGHLVRDHANRADAVRVAARGSRWWDDCADYEINDDLVEFPGLASVAEGRPGDAELPDRGLVETYFASRPDEIADDPSRPPRWDCGSGVDGVPRPWDDGEPGLSPTQADLLRQAVAAEIRQHEKSNPGSVPEGWLRWADTVSPSRTDWRRMLAAEIRKAAAAVSGRSDYTYRRPSRRTGAPTTAPRVLLASMQQPVPTVTVVVDTSGSMDEAHLGRVQAELEAVLSRVGLRGVGITALAVDTEVQASAPIRRARQLQLRGGGGTDMAAGIDAAVRSRPRPDVIIVLTDGLTAWPSTPPRGVRVIVGLLRNGSSPDAEWRPPSWARTVLIDQS